MVYINLCLPFKRFCVFSKSKNKEMRMYKRDFLHTILNMNTYCNFPTLRFVAVTAMIYEHDAVRSGTCVPALQSNLLPASLL